MRTHLESSASYEVGRSWVCDTPSPAPPPSNPDSYKSPKNRAQRRLNISTQAYPTYAADFPGRLAAMYFTAR